MFRANLPEFDWCSIESGSTGAGIPDSNFCCNGVEGFVEFKQTTGHTCPLRPEQVGWIARRVRAGGRVFIACRARAAAGKRRPARDDLWLIPGLYAKEAKAQGLGFGYGDVRVWYGGPQAWDWRAIAGVLVS